MHRKMNDLTAEISFAMIESERCASPMINSDDESLAKPQKLADFEKNAAKHTRTETEQFTTECTAK